MQNYLFWFVTFITVKLSVRKPGFQLEFQLGFRISIRQKTLKFSGATLYNSLPCDQTINVIKLL